MSGSLQNDAIARFLPALGLQEEDQEDQTSTTDDAEDDEPVLARRSRRRASSIRVGSGSFASKLLKNVLNFGRT